jgi:cobalt-precorrin 5A hydrolase
MERDTMRVAGLGFRHGANEQSLADALARAGGEVDALATPADKAEAPAIVALAQTLGLPVVAVPGLDLRAAPTLTHSDRVMAKRGTGSVAEAAALAAAGPGARLVAARVVSGDRMATCAIATGEVE